MTMRAILTKAADKGFAEVFLGETAKPKLTGPASVLVRVKATGVNRADLVQRQGKYPAPPGASEILGLEIAGEVAELGEEAKKTWKSGDRVMGLLAGGGYAEYAEIHYSNLMQIPGQMSFEQAAGIPEAFLTAYQALEYVAGFSGYKSPSVMIHAAASGVGTSAIQLCKYWGVNPIIGTASPGKHEACRNLGATHLIDYTKTPAFSQEVLKITNKKGADIILDFIGAQYWNENLRSLAVDGTMTMQGSLGGLKVENAELGAILMKRLQIKGSTLRARDVEYKARLISDFSKLLPLFEKGTLKPIIDKVFPWQEVDQAHQHVQSNANVGKVILTVD